MKKNFTFLATLFCLTIGAAMAQNIAYVTINPMECVNCLNQLKYISRLGPETPKSFVFAKKYQGDSAALIRKMGLEDFKDDIVWSDSLYRLYSGTGLVTSTISLFNKESGNTVQTYMVSLGNNWPYLASINRSDTLSLSARAFGAETILKNSGQYLYCFDELSSEVRAFDKINGQHLYTLAMTDSLVKEGFKLHFGPGTWESEYQKSKAYCAINKTIDAQVYKTMACTNDTLYLLGYHYYVYTVNNADEIDTVSIPFLTLSIYKNGVLKDFSLVENYIGPEWKGIQRGMHRVTWSNKPVAAEKSYYVTSGGIVTYKGKLFLSLIGVFAQGIPNHFLAAYKKDETQRKYGFDSFYPSSLPKEYDSIGYNYTQPMSSHGPYVALCLSDHIFSLDPSFPDLDLNFLSGVPGVIKSKWIFDLKVTRENVYLVYTNPNDEHLHYVKYSLKDKKAIVDLPLIKGETAICVPSIDSFDPDFVYIALADKTVMRKKAGR